MYLLFVPSAANSAAAVGLSGRISVHVAQTRARGLILTLIQTAGT